MLNSDYASLAWEQPASVWQGILRADQMAWLDVQNLTAVQRAQEHTAAYGPLAREAFLGLYAQSPALADPPHPSLRALSALFSRAEYLSEWQGLRATAADDAVTSAFGAAAFAFDLLGRLPENVKDKLQEAQAAAQEQEAIADQLQQLHDLAQGMGQEKGLPDLQQQIAALQEQLGPANARAEQAVQTAEQAIESAKARTDHALAQALAQSASELAEIQSAARAFGIGWGTGTGPGSKTAIDALEQLAGYLRGSPMLKQILAELGWAKRLVSEQVRKTQSGRDSFTHYQTGTFTPEDLAPEEWTGLLLAGPASPLALDFLARSLDDDLLHRRYQGDEAAGRGPIVFVRDTSGSMQSPPLKNAVAATLELALMQWAMTEHRRFVAIPFSGPGQSTLYDPGPRPDLALLLDHLTFGYWGGTEPYRPLEQAIQLIVTDPHLKQGDILILTDGAFRSPPTSFLDTLQAARVTPGLRVVAVVIDRQPGAAAFADRVILIRDLLKERERLAQAIGAVVLP